MLGRERDEVAQIMLQNPHVRTSTASLRYYNTRIELNQEIKTPRFQLCHATITLGLKGCDLGSPKQVRLDESGLMVAYLTSCQLKGALMSWSWPLDPRSISIYMQILPSIWLLCCPIYAPPPSLLARS